MCPLKWYYCVADEAGPCLAIWVSDLHTCIASKVHYQRLEIPVILYRTLASFHQNYRPCVETRAASFPHFSEPSFQHVRAKQSQILPQAAGKSESCPFEHKGIAICFFPDVFPNLSLRVPTLRTSHESSREGRKGKIYRQLWFWVLKLKHTAGYRLSSR